MIALSASPARAQTYRILSELQSVFPHSTPGPPISTPDGSFVFVAEAGTLAVLEMLDATDTTLATAGFQVPIKSEPISSQGARAVELLLDPDAELELDPDGPEALIYVAAGRLGLWAMQADPRSGYPMLATRIDDGTYQAGSGNTWCNSLELIEIGETRYLVALFAHEGCSRLRLYELDAVRQLFDTTVTTYEETGNELPPDADVGIGGNCQWQTPRYGSFGYGMAVEDKYVYVAMGSYGLVRVSFTTISSWSIGTGPWFGTGSYYASSVHAGYDDYEFRQPDPTDDTLFVVTRQVPPYFVDVAVQDDGQDRLLWAAVDHLGIVAFDLTSTWSTTMPIVHQEGIWVASSGAQDAHIELVDDPETTARENFAHRLAIVEATGDETSGLVLAVAVNTRPLLLSDAILDEGRTLGHLGQGYQGTGWPSGDITLHLTLEELWDEEQSLLSGTTAKYGYTVLYDLPNLSPETPAATTKSIQHAKFLRKGDRHVYLPTGAADDELLVVGGHAHARPGSTPSETFLAKYAYPFTGNPEVQPDPTQNELWVRSMTDRPGWHTYDISHSPTRVADTTQELLYLGSTDGGCLPAGIMATCGAEIARFTAAAHLPDSRGTFGILYDPLAVWPAPEDSGEHRDFIFGAGRPTTTQGIQKPHWMMVHFDPGEDLCATTPTRLPDRQKEIYVQSPMDNFTHRGRGFYNGCGGINENYDAHITPQENATLLAFVGRSATPAGIYVLDRSELEAQILGTGVSDGDIIDETVITAAYHRELLTHPEFANAYAAANPTNPADPLRNFLGVNGLNGPVLTLYPELIQLPKPEADPRWMLAVPCAAVYLPPDLEVFESDPSYPDPTTHPWYPDPVYVTNFNHAMVRVFDVDTYSEVIGSADPEVYTLLAPREESGAVRIKTLTWNPDSEEDPRHFLFVTNFTDSIMVWEVTHLLGRTDKIVDPGDTGDYDDYFLEEWITPLSVSDDLPNNAWHIEIVNEVWTDDQEAERNEIYVYVAVGRYGIAVLNFLPDASSGQRWVQVGHLRTPNGMAGLRIRDDGDEERTLLITETHTGLRTYTYPE